LRDANKMQRDFLVEKGPNCSPSDQVAAAESARIRELGEIKGLFFPGTPNALRERLVGIRDFPRRPENRHGLGCCVAVARTT
jgi:hypothetical protein